jgi:L-glutamine:2-deoxy-scyllo-inosose/3-amino-2,3-dideoxy-scyllo-inosose aminotransferase
MGQYLAINGGESVAHWQAPPWPVSGPEEERRLLQVLHEGPWANGPMEATFREAWASFCGSRFAVLTTGGTTALQLALEALDVGYGDEVLVPGTTWQATAVAVLEVNAVPVLVDVEPDTWCLDPQAAEAAVTPRTRAVIAVHTFGRLADLDALRTLAQRHGLALVEDCAHAHGACWRDRGAGAIGDLGCFSFQESKAMTAGEGGAIITDDERLAVRLDSLRNCGRPSRLIPPERQSPPGSGNYRITEWQAAVLLAQLDRLPEQLNRREVAAAVLDERLAELPGVAPLRRHPSITRQSYYAYSFQFIPEVWDGVSRETFRRAVSAELGAPALGAPYEPLNDCSLYQPHSKRRHRLSDDYWAATDPAWYHLPVAEWICREEGVLLPHPYLLLPAAAMERLAEAIEKVFEHREELASLAVEGS